MSVARRPALVSGRHGSLFLLELGPPAGVARATVIACAPFAEEMNRSRRMLVLFGEALAGRDIRCVLFDYSGTGDSAGEFGEATVARWLDDASDVARLVKVSARPVVWLGVRFGAHIAAEMARTCPDTRGLLLWQPVILGRTLVAQFLRLHTAAQITGAAAPAAEDPRQRLAQGQSAAVAGYELSPDLVGGLERLDLLQALSGLTCPADWMEIVAPGLQELPPGAQRAIDSLSAAGRRPTAQALAGDPFWSTPEQTLVPALIGRSIETVERWLSDG